MEGLSHEPLQVPVNEPSPVCLSTVKDSHPFLFSFSASIYLLGQDFFFFLLFILHWSIDD